MHFQVKNTLKNNHNQTFKHYFNLQSKEQLIYIFALEGNNALHANWELGYIVVPREYLHIIKFLLY
jgi:hypothetical protein